jgi:hypothetical protein
MSMPSVQKTSISDPLRPRPLNLSTLPVTPVRLAARFDDNSDDICLTELVARATDAAAFFNAAHNPLPSDSDDEGVDPTAVDPLKFLPVPLQGLPDGATPQVAIPSSGSQALEYMKRTSVTAARKDYSYIIGVVLGLVPLSISDPHLYRAHRGHIQSCEALFIEWEKSAAHKLLIQRFVKEFRELSGQKLTKSMEMFHEYLIQVKKASAQVAFTAMIYHFTVEHRSYNSEPALKMRSREVQLIMWLVMYMETNDEEYVSKFRQDCINRDLDLTSIADCTIRASSQMYPAFNRLAMCEEETMTMSWSWILRDLCAYLGGAQINNELDIKALNLEYFVPEDVNVSHDLRFEVLPDGSFTDVLDWLTDELHARTAINTVANQAGILSWVIDDYKTVGNMLSAMKTAESMDLYTAWWKEYRRSDKVPANVVIPTGEWPIIEVSLCKTLMRDAEKDLIANVPLQRERAAIVANKQRQQPARQPGATRPGKQQPPPPNEKKKCRICKKVPDDGHNTAKCPNRTGGECHKWMAGKCGRGTDCCYEHPARPAEPAAPAAPATPVPAAPHGAPPPYKPAPAPVPSQSALPAALENFTPMAETGTQEISCRNTTSPECTPNFMCDLAYWGKLVNEKAKEGIEYCLPKSCDNCRAYDKTHRSASMMTGQPSPEPAPTPEPVSTPDGSHENDGANDDYDYYHDYDVSMGSAGMVTSIEEVAQVDWWAAAHSTATNAQVDDVPSYHMATNEHVGFATIPVVPKCSIQLLLTDYNLADDNDVPIQLDVLAHIPAWVVAAHAEMNLLTDDVSSLMLAVDAIEVPLKKYSMKVGKSIDGPSSLRAFCEIGTVNLLADVTDSDVKSNSSSEDMETVARLCPMDSALPTDHARYTLRQYQKFGVPVTAALKEVANLEADNSLDAISMEPVNCTRASCPPDPSGYAILGDQVDINLSMDDETAAALMDSPADHEASIDLESSGSDHQINNEGVRRLKKHYVNAMDKDARELVMLFPTADSNLDGDLMLSTNTDEVVPDVDSNFH